MEIDPMETVENVNEENERTKDKRQNRLNSFVAVTVALLATFMGICNVKAGNVAQKMEYANTERANQYAWYQSRNIREDVYGTTAALLTAQAQSLPLEKRATLEAKAAEYKALSESQNKKKEEQKKAGDKADEEYKELNIHDDQFDLAEAFISLAIALLALCSLTQQGWMFVLAMFPTIGGVMMGLAGLTNSHLQIGWLSSLLG